jgi:VWFA-related protein
MAYFRGEWSHSMGFRPHRNSSTSALLALALASLFSLAEPSSASSQQQRPQTPRSPDTVARIETELVQIDVVVTTRDGKPVGDLKREDFAIFEDGKQQQVTHFAVGSASQPAAWLDTQKRRPRSAPAATETPVELHGRYIVFAIDDLHISPANLMFAKQTLQKFVRDQFSGGDQAAIATTSGTLGLLQQFTSERAVLSRAIDRLRVQQIGGMAPMFDIPQMSDYQAELIDRGDVDALELAVQEILAVENPQSAAQVGGSAQGTRGASGGAGGGTSGAPGGMTPREIAIQRSKSKARMIVSEISHYSQMSLISVDGVVRSLKDLPGRKLVILVSDGFFLGGDSSRVFDIRRITDAATRSGVVIYSLDSRGLIATAPGGDASEPSHAMVETSLPGVRSRIENGAIEAKRNGMNALASDTGGRLLINTNDFNNAIQQVLDENATYYVMAWEPETSYRDGRFRRIEVKVPGRPELKVRTRKGYFAPDDKEAEEKAKAEAALAKRAKEDPADKAVKAQKENQIRAGLTSLFPLKAIPIELSADFVDLSDGGQVAIVTAHVDASSLTFVEENQIHKAVIDVVTLVFDEKGKIAGNVSEKLALNVPPNFFESVRKNGFTYRKLISLKQSGFHQVRLAVREDGSGLVGSATRWVEVPDLKSGKLTLSSVLMMTSLKEVESDKTIQFEPRPTQARRNFPAGGGIDFLVFTYFPQVKDGKTDVVIQSQVFSGSKLIYSSPLSRVQGEGEGVPDLQRLPYAARLTLEGFEPGEYELRVVVIDRSSKQTADRRANFTIVR